MSKRVDTIAIVGGGFTGAAVAYHLAPRIGEAKILVIEPRASLGGGLAYDVEDDAYRINVPAGKMSLVPGDDGHFARWVAQRCAVADDPQALAGDGELYPRRAVFGRYVADHLRPLTVSGRVTHVRETAIRIARQGSGWAIVTDAGSSYPADVVVLATTHPPPALPAVLAAPLEGDPRLIADASEPGALAAIAPDAAVLIVGTGLTMADVVASLDARGHYGKITAVSRRGLLSRGHPTKAAEPFGTYTGRPHTARSLLAAIRSAIETASRQGLGWHCVIDAVRAQAQTFWPHLALAEQRRIVRHLRAYWDVHRFRVAPQLKAVLDRRIREGTLEIIAGSLVGAAAGPSSLFVDIRRRRDGSNARLAADNVIVTTGPAHASALSTEPHLASLARGGWISRDAVGLGIACDRNGRALDAAGRAIANLFIAGPLARGTFGELMGLPQVSDYALLIAEQVARTWRIEREHQVPLEVGQA